MPSLLNIWGALLAAGIVIPLLLVLYFLKLRRQEFVVPSTLLWRKAVRDLQVNAPFQKLRKNLLLLLQLLLLLLLILALARPVMNAGQRAGKLSVILIDRSASMSAKDVEEGARTRLEEAKRKARELVDTMDADAVAMVVAFDDSAQIVQSFTADKQRLKTAIDSVAGTDRRSKLGDAYDLAQAQATASLTDEQRRGMGNAAPPTPDVWLFSDGRVSDARQVGYKGKLTYTPVGSRDAKNVAVVTLNAKRIPLRPSEVQVFARLANHGPEPVEEVGVTLSVNDVVHRVDQKLLLLPERWSAEQRKAWEGRNAGKVPRDSVEFSLDLMTSAVIRLEHKAKEGDVLAADDAAQVIVPEPKTLSVCLVTEANLFIQRAIDSMKLKNVVVRAPNVFERELADPEKVAKDYDVILFDRWDPPKLPPVGNFVYFGCVPPGTALKARANAAGERVLAKDVGVLYWQRDHALFTEIKSLARLYVAEMLTLDVPPQQAETLVQGTEGPMIVRMVDGRSVHLVIAFDVLMSNWPQKPTFPVFMNNLVTYLAVGADMELRQSLPPGATPTVPRLSLQQAGANLKDFQLVGPGGSRTVTIPESGEVTLPPLDRVGLYTTEPKIPQFEQLAVNLLDDNESNLIPADKAPGDLSGTGETASSRPMRRELWWPLVCAAVPLCLLEWWVYTRRIHL